MINKPEGYDEAKVGGGFKSLPAGGYICKIKKAFTMYSKAGNEMLRMAIDIAVGEYADYFQKMFERKRQQNPEAKWPCQYYQLMDGKYVGSFKRFMELLAECNDEFEVSFPMPEEKLEGLLFGGLFREEEYIGNDGKKHSNVKCYDADRIDGIMDKKPPEPKRIEESHTYDASSGTYEEIPF